MTQTYCDAIEKDHVQIVPLHNFPILILFQGLGYPAKEIGQERLFDLESFDLESLPYPGRTAGTEDENRVNWEMKDKSLLGED